MRLIETGGERFSEGSGVLYASCLLVVNEAAGPRRGTRRRGGGRALRLRCQVVLAWSVVELWRIKRCCRGLFRLRGVWWIPDKPHHLNLVHQCSATKQAKKPTPRTMPRFLSFTVLRQPYSFFRQSRAIACPAAFRPPSLSNFYLSLRCFSFFVQPAGHRRLSRQHWGILGYVSNMKVVKDPSLIIQLARGALLRVGLE